MKYKGEFSPSYLADPVCYSYLYCPDQSSLTTLLQEDFNWHPLSACENALERFRYACFTHPEHSLEGPPPSIGIGTCLVTTDFFFFRFSWLRTFAKEPPPEIPKTTLSELRYILAIQEGLPISVPVTVSILELSSRSSSHHTICRRSQSIG